MGLSHGFLAKQSAEYHAAIWLVSMATQLNSLMSRKKMSEQELDIAIHFNSLTSEKIVMTQEHLSQIWIDVSS